MEEPAIPAIPNPPAQLPLLPHEAAAKYLGKKELPGNVWSKEDELGKKLHEAGQKDGEAYCAYFTEVVFKEAYPERTEEFTKLFSANAVQTHKNFVKAGYPDSKVPKPDSLVIWIVVDNGKPVNYGTEKAPIYRGHAGVVATVNKNDNTAFYSYEANTTDGTKENREGGVVALKPHRVNLDVKKGLSILGFIDVTSKKTA